MLVIVNPYATSISRRLKSLVISALRGRYDVEAVDTRRARPRHRPGPARAGRGLRRRRRLRWRRHGQRGGQRPGRLGHAADLPARRRPERLRQAARHPRRRRRRHRAPARAGRRLATAARRPRARERAPVRLRLGPGPRRRRRALGRRQPGGQGPPAPLVLRRGRDPHLRDRVRGAPTVHRRRGGRADGPGSDRPRADRRRLHLLGPAAPARRRGRDPRRRRRWPGSSSSAPASIDVPSIIDPAVLGACASSTTAASSATTACRRLVCRSADGRPVPLQVDGDHIGDVVEARYEVVPGGLAVVA